MNREERKKRKKRLREDKKSAERRREAAKQKRASLYPQIVLDEEGGDSHFVAFVRDIVQRFNFENPDMCTRAQRQVYQMFREVGIREMLRRLAISKKEAPQHGFSRWTIEEVILDPLIMHMGEWIFAQLPEIYRVSPLPFAYFSVMPVGHELLIRFSFLPSITSPHGRIYFSGLEPRVAFGGGMWKVGFFRHAIERICERLCPTRTIGYAHFNSCAFYFRNCIFYEPLELPDGQCGIRLFQDCPPTQDEEDDPYISTVIGLKRHPGKSTKLYRVLGYCPVEFVGPRVVAKTFLYPGYRNTPEDRLVGRSTLAPDVKRELFELAAENNAEKSRKGDGLRAIKWYHDHGLPQVLELERDVFCYEPPPRR